VPLMQPMVGAFGLVCHVKGDFFGRGFRRLLPHLRQRTSPEVYIRLIVANQAGAPPSWILA